MPHHILGHRAQEPTLEAGPAIGAHDQQVGREFLGRAQDLPHGSPLADLRLHGNPAVSGGLHQFAELRLQPAARPGVAEHPTRVGGQGAPRAVQQRLDDVDDLDLRLLPAGQGQRVLECSPGEVREVGRAEDPPDLDHCP